MLHRTHPLLDYNIKIAKDFEFKAHGNGIGRDFETYPEAKNFCFLFDREWPALYQRVGKDMKLLQRQMEHLKKRTQNARRRWTSVLTNHRSIAAHSRLCDPAKRSRISFYCKLWRQYFLIIIFQRPIPLLILLKSQFVQAHYSYSGGKVNIMSQRWYKGRNRTELEICFPEKQHLPLMYEKHKPRDWDNCMTALSIDDAYLCRVERNVVCRRVNGWELRTLSNCLKIQKKRSQTGNQHSLSHFSSSSM